MNTLSEANGNFAIHLLKMLCESNPSTNVCYSPMSISSALAMVLLGAKGDTAVQMSQVSCLSPLTCFTCLRAAEKGGTYLRGKEFSTCQKFGKLADTILQCYLTEHVSLQTFKESCLQFYHSELEQLSFVKAAEESRKHINTWVSEQTEGKIPELLSGDSVNSETRLVLVNALYFKGKWHQPFHEDCTIEMPFKINQERTVQMMCQEDTFNIAYVNEVQAQVLVIPYKGMELSLVVLLPDDGVENNLTFEKLTSWTKPDFMRSTDVEVFLPKFKLQEDYDMESVFQRLGMVDVFQGGKADLSGMSLERDLCLSKFVHKSVVEVNEKGTEAAAATSAIVDYCCACEVSIFCADHPFLFFIRHNQTNTLLFCGRFSSP
uniref:Serpin domain-containing protein n=1 Tax=Peromyscus maniculatus bairdii TaxID=230844 RepID=A0A8C8UBD6_PERMB